MYPDPTVCRFLLYYIVEWCVSRCVSESKKGFPSLFCREEQDFEYACLVQEEMLRCAEEAQRREQDDEVGTNQLNQACITLTFLQWVD